MYSFCADTIYIYLYLRLFYTDLCRIYRVSHTCNVYFLVQSTYANEIKNTSSSSPPSSSSSSSSLTTNHHHHHHHHHDHHHHHLLIVTIMIINLQHHPSTPESSSPSSSSSRFLCRPPSRSGACEPTGRRRPWELPNHCGS